MQYGAKLSTYERTLKAKKKEVKKTVDGQLVIKLLIYFISSILVSRVLLINYIAPFGIAFLIAVLIYGEEKVHLVAGGGTLIGYVSLIGSIDELPSYMVLVAVITLTAYLTKNIGRKKQLLVMFSLIFIEVIAYKYFISKLTLDIAALSAALEAGCIFPLYFIINYSIVCFKNLNTKHLFTNEEVISMAVTASLVISGTWGVNIAGVSIRNILALLFIVVISYVKGSTVGAASGVAMGVIIGVCSNNLPIYISVYGLCGLIGGLFKNSGKLLTVLSYIVAFAIIKIYSNIQGEFKIIEVLISGGIFFILPLKFYNRLILELDFHKKQDYISGNYVDKIKGILVNRLDSFSDVLTNMSTILENLAENDKLVMKNKSAALIENLADRVCSNCNMKSMCWNREAYYTYNAFGELIQNYQERKQEMPEELDRKCVKRTMLSKNTEEIVNNYVINEMWRKRLSEGRELLSSQIGNMASSVSEIIDEFNANIKIDVEAENNIRRILDRSRIKYNDVFCLCNKNNRLIVKIKMHSCSGTQLCVKEVLPLISQALHKNMCISDDGCNIDINDSTCTVTFEEAPKFHVASHAMRICKEGENYSGDSYTFGKLSDGTYMTIISDGMGSGPQAEQESNAAVELIEKFAHTGFNKITAINTVNSIMTLKFSADEKFSTVDLSSLDLYTGEAEFMKVGAVASFIKSGSKVEVIKSKTLPMGVLDKVDVDIIKRKVKNGDIVVMLTDGMLDYNNEAAGKVDWMVDFLENSNCGNPKDLVEQLVEKAKELSGGKVKDDMTVVVSKVYSLY
ncbi:stage II sporulation protein E [Clostridium sp. YIM B02515]|uniref:Stage II sporulation protein E n=1 Tax=Clostridium rhizosphaerae TaxID=2803861 RepID=A0ABS1TDR5_9CLOT|nr:stage II sporulation protein E [Clostridium rhizosphaerae]MBL4936922.1 stage II sporulation protein E [Clostridium rhizosphaerae]